jgi:PilZ domain
MTPAGDRRSQPRFEIVGGLWGTFEMVLALTVVNISRGGLLVTSPVQLERDSVHRLMMRRGDLQAAVDVKVCRSERAAGEVGPEFLMGCEFVSRTSAMEALLNDGQAEVGGV